MLQEPRMISPEAQIDKTAVVHPTAVIEGNIRIGPYCYIGSHVTLHGDVTIDAYTYIGAGTAMVGIIDIGREVNICLNCSIRGAQRMKIGSHVSIFDNVNIESGRGWHWQDESCIEDWCWINHGAVMHGAAVREGAAIGMGATLNYGSKIGRNAIVGDGSAVAVEMIVPDNALAQGVPAQIVRRDLGDEDRVRIMGLDTRQIIRLHGQKNVEQGHCGWQQIRM
jgi:carbonic anhydrase/acetyltransferase-like protein (isoleucine patch superfamily)